MSYNNFVKAVTDNNPTISVKEINKASLRIAVIYLFISIALGVLLSTLTNIPFYFISAILFTFFTLYTFGVSTREAEVIEFDGFLKVSRLWWLFSLLSLAGTGAVLIFLM